MEVNGIFAIHGILQNSLIIGWKFDVNSWKTACITNNFVDLTQSAQNDGIRPSSTYSFWSNLYASIKLLFMYVLFVIRCASILMTNGWWMMMQWRSKEQQNRDTDLCKTFDDTLCLPSTDSCLENYRTYHGELPMLKCHCYLKVFSRSFLDLCYIFSSSTGLNIDWYQTDLNGSLSTVNTTYR